MSKKEFLYIFFNSQVLYHSLPGGNENGATTAIAAILKYIPPEMQTHHTFLWLPTGQRRYDTMTSHMLHRVLECNQ